MPILDENGAWGDVGKSKIIETSRARPKINIPALMSAVHRQQKKSVLQQTSEIIRLGRSGAALTAYEYYTIICSTTACPGTRS